MGAVASRGAAAAAGKAATTIAHRAPEVARDSVNTAAQHAQQVLERVNARPELFRRLDENGPGFQDARLSDPEAASVAGRASDGAGGAAVGIQRILASSDAASLSEQQRSLIHSRSETTVGNVAALDGAIRTTPGDPVGAVSIASWEAMQLNPKLLDSAVALARAPTQLILAQMALGYVPASARGDGGPAILPPGGLASIAGLISPTSASRHLGISDASDSSSDNSSTSNSDSALSPHKHGPSNELVATAESIDALVPAGVSLDSLIVARERPVDVTAWGPRPIEASPYDQLILHDPDEEFALERGEVFELFARQRSDPGYWTSQRLAEYYDTKREWVDILLDAVSPPVFVREEGEMYGVYTVRSMDALHTRLTRDEQSRREQQASRTDAHHHALSDRPAEEEPRGAEKVEAEAIDVDTFRRQFAVSGGNNAAGRGPEAAAGSTRKRNSFVGARKR